mgnify:CR=1 FL=1
MRPAVGLLLFIFMEGMKNRELVPTKHMSAHEKKKYLEKLHPEWFECGTTLSSDSAGRDFAKEQSLLFNGDVLER